MKRSAQTVRAQQRKVKLKRATQWLLALVWLPLLGLNHATLFRYAQRHELTFVQITYLTDEQKAAFANAISEWKGSMIERFGTEACDAFGITQ